MAEAEAETSTPQPSGYYALRRGKTAKGCIFLFWEDCKEQVDGSAEAEFSFFVTLDDASEYILADPNLAKRREQVAATTTADCILVSRIEDLTAAAVAEEDQDPASAQESSKAATDKPSDDAPSEKSLDGEDTPAFAQNIPAKESAGSKDKASGPPAAKPPAALSTKKKKKSTGKNDGTKKRKKRSRDEAATEPENVKKRKRNPTTRWRETYETLKQYKEEHGSLDISPSDKERAALRKWVQKQKLQYKLLKEGKPSSMYEEKIQLLNGIGFELESAVTAKAPRTMKPRKEWLDMLERLKEYKKAHGSCDIPKGNEEHEELRVWLKEQNQLYLRMREGKQAHFSEEKAEKLSDLGFEFEPTWSERIAEMKQLKQEHGSVFFQKENDNTGLMNWMKKTRAQYLRSSEGKSSRLNKDQLDELTALGFKDGPQAVNSEAEERHWNEMLEELRRYKEQHGNTMVPQAGGTPLSKWVTLQRRDYNRLNEGKPSNLTAKRLQKLNEVGFAFRPRGGYASWEKRLEELREYKQLFGHVKIATNHPTLGTFVSKVRSEYKKFLDGRPTAMTEERKQQLLDLGFIFQAGKTPVRTVTEQKSWAERFEELLQFKEEYGHTVVPQNSGRLGQWVHSQRVHYKRLKQGKPSQLSAEKALKLADIGFVFNAKRYKTENTDYYSEEE